MMHELCLQRVFNPVGESRLKMFNNSIFTGVQMIQCYLSTRDGDSLDTILSFSGFILLQTVHDIK